MASWDPGVSRKLLEGKVGELLLRPWFDRAALWFLVPWFFPLSRMWAAGLECGGSVEEFRRRTGARGLPDGVVAAALAKLSAQHGRLRRADARWRAAFFENEGPASALSEIEAARRDEAHRLMAARSLFLPLRMTGHVLPLRLEIVPPSGAALPASPYAPPGDLPAIVESRPIRHCGCTVSWLRFRSPSLHPSPSGDDVWARVVTPPDFRSGGPTLVHAHGVCVESEYWPIAADRLDALIDDGMRIVFPEGPGHGRRRWPGWFGGEPVLGRGPVGLFDYFDTHLGEMAALVAWARRTSPGGRVAVGGVSLGALTSQLLIGACAGWPAALRPDAALLVVPGRSVLKVAMEGSLTAALGVPQALRRAGWSEAALEPWRAVLEPSARPGIDPENIVVALGTEDDVTLYDEGVALARSWGVPADNVFAWRRGHFSTALGLARDAEPLHRLHDILTAA